MADGYATALQAGLIAALAADGAVAALVKGRVEGDPPDDAPLPYVRVGSIEPRPMRSTAGKGARVTFAIEAHTRRARGGRVEASRIAEAVADALNENEAAVPLGARRLVSLEWVTTTVDRAPDGQTHVAVAAFEAVIDG